MQARLIFHRYGAQGREAVLREKQEPAGKAPPKRETLRWPPLPGSRKPHRPGRQEGRCRRSGNPALLQAIQHVPPWFRFHEPFRHCWFASGCPDQFQTHAALKGSKTFIGEMRAIIIAQCRNQKCLVTRNSGHGEQASSGSVCVLGRVAIFEMKSPDKRLCPGVR